MEIGIGKALRKIIEEIVNQRPALLPGGVQGVGRGTKGPGQLGGRRPCRAFRVGEEQPPGVARKVKLGNDPNPPLRRRLPKAMKGVEGQVAFPATCLMKPRATPAFKGHALIVR